MSKNKRLLRGFFAGMFFIGMGVIGSISSDRYRLNEAEAPVSRGPASTACGLCDELKRIKNSMATRPASVTSVRPNLKSDHESLDPLNFKSRAKRALAESLDAVALRKAGALISDMVRMREPGDDELRAITIFFATTSPRDGAGIVLDMVSETLSVEKTDSFINAIEAQLAALVFEKVLQRKQSEALKASFSAFRDQSTAGQD